MGPVAGVLMQEDAMKTKSSAANSRGRWPVGLRGQALLPFALAAIAILLAPRCGFASDQVFEQSYPLHAGGSFLLENVNGSVEVDGWDRDEVEVRAVKVA